jgi:hypothetical protein
MGSAESEEIMKRHRVLAAMTLLAFTVAGGVPAHGVDQSRGTPGYCTDAQGVTVVIDFGDLGGTPIVRCNPQSGAGTGLDALKGAGFQIAGVQRWGESFICRIENRPAPGEKIAIKGNANYREACIDTPPASGYWSYWHAGNNCEWEYSQWGVKNREFVPGGFEGWVFSLNASMDDAPKPSIAASRPGTQGQACNAPDEPAPTSNDPDQKQSQVAKQPQASETNSATGQLPAPKPRETTQAQADGDVVFSGGEDAPDVAADAKASGMQRFAPFVAAGVIGLLIASAIVTARRRSARNADQ